MAGQFVLAEHFIKYLKKSAILTLYRIASCSNFLSTTQSKLNMLTVKGAARVVYFLDLNFSHYISDPFCI